MDLLVKLTHSSYNVSGATVKEQDFYKVSIVPQSLSAVISLSDCFYCTIFVLHLTLSSVLLLRCPPIAAGAKKVFRYDI